MVDFYSFGLQLLSKMTRIPDDELSKTASVTVARKTIDLITTTGLQRPKVLQAATGAYAVTRGGQLVSYFLSGRVLSGRLSRLDW
jgi:hypothetical protein